METRLAHIDDMPVQSGPPKDWISVRKPELFAGKHEVRLAKPLGLTQFGANQLTLDPGAHSALRHWHAAEDEFVYVLSGELTLIDSNGAHTMRAGSFAAFPAGEANAHHLVNRSEAPATYLAMGTRNADDVRHYPDDDFSYDRARGEMLPFSG